jgi:hypothetical protein
MHFWVVMNSIGIGKIQTNKSFKTWSQVCLLPSTNLKTIFFDLVVMKKTYYGMRTCKTRKMRLLVC